MGISSRLALAALPVLALAQNSSYQYYTFTVNSQLTTITLPAVGVPATTVTQVTSSPVATLTSTLSDTAAPASTSTTTSQEGETIPITIQGYVTTIVLPYWASAPHPSGPLTTSTVAAAVAVFSDALSSDQARSSQMSNAAAVVSSVFSAASASASSVYFFH